MCQLRVGSPEHHRESNKLWQGRGLHSWQLPEVWSSPTKTWGRDTRAYLGGRRTLELQGRASNLRANNTQEGMCLQTCSEFRDRKGTKELRAPSSLPGCLLGVMVHQFKLLVTRCLVTWGFITGGPGNSRKGDITVIDGPGRHQPLKDLK